MRKMIYLLGIVLLFSSITWAQEKIEAPVWNVGDKWAFTGNGNIEVVKADKTGYFLKFSDGKCVFESQGCNTILFQNSSLNRINAVEGDKSKKYVMGLSKALDFPLNTGKQWKSAYSSSVVSAWSGHRMTYDYSEIFKALGWENVEVRAGNFKAFRLEYRRKMISASGVGANVGEEIINQYWYSPDAKYFVKCEYDKDWMKGNKEIFNWELTSFQLKK